MLYVFVDKEQCHVYYATYDEDSAKKLRERVDTELVTRYWDDVEIYEVKEDYDD